MHTINRGIVVIKPKEPMIKWINEDPSNAPPVSMEELQQDCTTLLVPNLIDREAVLSYLEPLKPALFEMELESWSRDESRWPQPRTSELFDAWFALEVHSMVWDGSALPIEKENDEPVTDLSGTWKVVFSPDLDDDYLYMETVPHVTLRQTGLDLTGEFHLGLIVGNLDGRVEGNQVVFSFGATAELDPLNGAGTITLSDQRLAISLMFHLGDTYHFECEPTDEGLIPQ